MADVLFASADVLADAALLKQAATLLEIEVLGLSASVWTSLILLLVIAGKVLHRTYRVGRWVAVNCALGRSPGTATFRYHHRASMMSTAYPDSSPEERRRWLSLEAPAGRWYGVGGR